MAIEQDPRLLQWDGACPVWDWHVALAVEMKMKAVMMTVNSRHNGYLRFRDSSHLSSLAAVLLVTVKVCQHSLSYFHFYYETRTRLPGEQMGKQWYYNGICQIILHMSLSLKILTHTHTHTHSYMYTNICVYTWASWPRPPREDMMVISCCRKTWAALIRALDCPWGCDLTSRGGETKTVLFCCLITETIILKRIIYLKMKNVFTLMSVKMFLIPLETKGDVLNLQCQKDKKETCMNCTLHSTSSWVMNRLFIKNLPLHFQMLL